METESIRSPFYEIAASLGATFMEESGWYWTEGFGDEDAEYHGVREDLGVWDVSPLNKWEFTGPDSLAAPARGLSEGKSYRDACTADSGSLSWWLITMTDEPGIRAITAASRMAALTSQSSPSSAGSCGAAACWGAAAWPVAAS